MKEIAISKWAKIRKIIVYIIIAAIAGVAIYNFGFKPKEKPGPVYETSKVGKSDIISKVMATGTLSALVTVQVGSQVSGRLQKIMVDYNSRVKKGQVLAQIDQQMFTAAVNQAKANLLAAQSNLDKAKIQAADAERLWGRNSSLLEKNLISQAEVDTSKSSADMAKAQITAAEGGLAQAQASLQQAEINLGYTTIVSPINGIVISRSVDTGQTVAASFQAPTLFTIAEDLSRMQVDTNVSEADVGKLTPDMTAAFTVDAYPSEKFSGKVRQIRNAPQIVQNVVTYDAVIDVENPELKLKPGMTASVSFIYAKKENVLFISNAALRFKPLSDMPEFSTEKKQRKPAASDIKKEAGDTRRTIWVLRNNKPVEISVKTGITDGIITEVESTELTQGDEIVTDATAPKTTNMLFGRPPGPSRKH